MLFHDIHVDSSPDSGFLYNASKANIRQLAADVESAGPLHPQKPDENILSKLRHEYGALESTASQGLMSTAFLLIHILPEWLQSNAGLRVEVKSQDLPIGAGLGSSAAFSVALVGALMLYRQRTMADVLSKEDVGSDVAVPATPPPSVLAIINEWSYSSEIVIHGAPSGLDNTTSCMGTFVQSVACSLFFVILTTVHHRWIYSI